VRLSAEASSALAPGIRAGHLLLLAFPLIFGLTVWVIVLTVSLSRLYLLAVTGRG
jgi:hypothetical protein